jgi:hypothetical protein
VADNTPLAIFAVLILALGRGSVYLFRCCVDSKATLNSIVYAGAGLVVSLVDLVLAYVLVVGLWEIVRKVK